MKRWRALAWAVWGLNALLLTANLGWLPGLDAGAQREPQRLLTQIQPQALQVLDSAALAGSEPRAPAQAESAAQCWQTEALDAASASQAGAALQALAPQLNWTLVAQPASRWWVVWGPYANAAERTRKRSQLAALGLSVKVPDEPALAQALALGAFDTRDQAVAALREAEARGARTARVEAGAQPAAFALRLRAVNADQRSRLQQSWPWALSRCDP
ncbi:MAG: hypothetical protein OHK0048_02660 [Rhodoferax sp.]